MFLACPNVDAYINALAARFVNIKNARVCLVLSADRH